MKSSGSRPGSGPYSVKSVRRRRSVMRWRIFFSSLIVLIAAAVIVTVLALFNHFFGNGGPSSSISSASGSIPSAESMPPSASPSPSPSPTPPVIDDVFSLSSPPLEQAAEPRIVQHNDIRALYIGAAANLDANIEIAKNSAVNAFVVDLKESNGVYFLAKDKLANDIKATKAGYSIETLVSKCKANGIKLIGRIVCFKDHVLADARPDLCIKDKDGNLILYPREGNKAFVDPYKTEIWEYNVSIAREAVALGFDEIQFDYVRFPVCNPTIRKAEYFGPEGTVPTKIECINRFLEYAKIEIQDKLGVPLSADIFGGVMVYKLDGQLIGQEWSSLGHLGLDVLSPMIYPSHFADGTVMDGHTFSNPDADTYAFLTAVYNQSGYKSGTGFSTQRPYIQAYDYTQAQIFGQIDALADFGITEYIYWNAGGKYDASLVR